MTSVIAGASGHGCGRRIRMLIFLSVFLSDFPIRISYQDFLSRISYLIFLYVASNYADTLQLWHYYSLPCTQTVLAEEGGLHGGHSRSLFGGDGSWSHVSSMGDLEALDTILDTLVCTCVCVVCTADKIVRLTRPLRRA
jgi:hypothetical protein